MFFNVLAWYLVISTIGIVVLPLTYALFKGLPDRGYGFSKIFGILASGYVFWLLGTLGIVQNDTGSTLFAFVILCLISVISLRKNSLEAIKDWLKSQRPHIITVEILFLFSFAGWAIIRATDPAILGTEKPMELAFINAILHSPKFPPHDPWLSGYSISYYYFGYVMVAMLARLASIPGSIAFNLAVASWFGLIAVGGYEILYNLLTRKFQKGDKQETLRNTWYERIFGLLAPLFILIVSNFEGFLEILHSKGIFWRQDGSGNYFSKFWAWIDIQELVNAPVPPFSWIPERAGGIWWWRASRVLQDYDLSGNSREIIDEFPFFSFLLGDLHPHVLAMPFVLLATGLALNVLFLGKGLDYDKNGVVTTLKDWVRGSTIDWQQTRVWVLIKDQSTWISALVIGSLAFLNTWDFPIYIGLFCAALVVPIYQKKGWKVSLPGILSELTITFFLLGVVLFFPFYISFSSQAGGIIPSMAFFTRGIHFWVMFGPLLIPVILWQGWILWKRRKETRLIFGIKFGGLLLVGLWAFSIFFGWLTASLPALGSWIQNIFFDRGLSTFSSKLIEGGNAYIGLQGAIMPGELLRESMIKRISNPGTWLTLLLMLAACWTLLGFSRQNNLPSGEDKNTFERLKDSDVFVILLVLLGTGLTLVPEYLYLRDQFGTRMNTIFKFYYQTWVLWAIAAAYASSALIQSLKGFGKSLFTILLTITLTAGLVYPYFGLRMKTNGIRIENLTLDGADYLWKYAINEMEAIQFLEQAPQGVVAEAVGGSYSSFGRVSTHSGKPTVLGWPGHEVQWRGGVKEIGSREEDIRNLYRTPDMNEARSIIDRYNISYIYVGPQERSVYRVNEMKFKEFMTPVFSNQDVVIYSMPE